MKPGILWFWRADPLRVKPKTTHCWICLLLQVQVLNCTSHIDSDCRGSWLPQWGMRPSEAECEKDGPMATFCRLLCATEGTVRQVAELAKCPRYGLALSKVGIPWKYMLYTAMVHIYIYNIYTIYIYIIYIYMIVWYIYIYYIIYQWNIATFHRNVKLQPKHRAQYPAGLAVPGHFLQEVFLGADFNGQLPMCAGCAGYPQMELSINGWFIVRKILFPFMKLYPDIDCL